MGRKVRPVRPVPAKKMQAQRPKVLLRPGAGSVPLDGGVKDGAGSFVQVSPRLEENLVYFNGILGQNVDFVVRQLETGARPGRKAALVYLSSLAGEERVEESILKPLLAQGVTPGGGAAGSREVFLALTAAHVREGLTDMRGLVEEVLSGAAVLLVEGSAEALAVRVEDWAVRSVEKTDLEGVVRGSKESFNESLEDNISLVRRRLRTPHLVFEGFKLGRLTSTPVALAYLTGVTSPELVEEVKRRLSRIDVDGILEGGYIEELIQDDPYTPFPQISYTERPDRVVAALLQGRVCIFTEGTPMTIFMPAVFQDMMQSPEDYYERYHFATAIRFLRYLAVIISLVLPSFYIAVITFHQEMVPTQLLISIAASREGVPFPTVVEALIMEVTFEALREAGLRLPRAVGQAISIVGALVVGQAAVQAGLVSPLMVIVVALTGVASFMAPTYNLALTLRLIRFFLMILAATLGLFGLMAGILAVLIHLAGLRSFGVPYLTPVAPIHVSDLKDFAVRAPWWAMSTRPQELVKDNQRRQAQGLKPGPPAGNEG